MALLDIFRRIPAAGIRINSRGEAVLRLRGSEERQTGIFLDGAPLSVPWDGRVDLSAILAAGIVDRVSVVASAAPIEYGANSALGVVQLSTPLESHSGLISAQAELGSQDSGSLSAVGGTQTGQADWLFGGSMRALGGEAVSSKSVIPYGPTQDGARVDPDLDSASLFVSLSTQPRWGAVKASPVLGRCRPWNRQRGSHKPFRRFAEILALSGLALQSIDGQLCRQNRRRDESAVHALAPALRADNRSIPGR